MHVWFSVWFATNMHSKCVTIQVLSHICFALMHHWKKYRPLMLSTAKIRISSLRIQTYNVYMSYYLKLGRQSVCLENWLLQECRKVGVEEHRAILSLCLCVCLCQIAPNGQFADKSDQLGGGGSLAWCQLDLRCDTRRTWIHRRQEDAREQAVHCTQLTEYSYRTRTSRGGEWNNWCCETW